MNELLQNPETTQEQFRLFFNYGEEGREEGRLGSELAQVLVYMMFKGWSEEVSTIEKKGKIHEKPGHACSDENKSSLRE